MNLPAVPLLCAISLRFAAACNKVNYYGIRDGGWER